MAKTSKHKVPSPCVDVCKFKREGHCTGCSMTKAQKSQFKELKKEKHREEFIEMLIAQQSEMGKFRHWAHAYRRKCKKKKVKPVAALKDVA